MIKNIILICFISQLGLAQSNFGNKKSKISLGGGVSFAAYKPIANPEEMIIDKGGFLSISYLYFVKSKIAFGVEGSTDFFIPQFGDKYSSLWLLPKFTYQNNNTQNATPFVSVGAGINYESFLSPAFMFEGGLKKKNLKLGIQTLYDTYNPVFRLSIAYQI